MEILIGLFIITVIGLILVHVFDALDSISVLGFALSLAGGILFVSSLVLVPIERMATNSEISEFQEVRITAERMRERGYTWESAAFQTKVAECNAWLASKKYYNDTVFDLWIPDEVDNLDPIE